MSLAYRIAVGLGLCALTAASVQAQTITSWQQFPTALPAAPGTVCMVGDSITAATTSIYTIGLTATGGTGPYSWGTTGTPSGLGTSALSQFYLFPSTAAIGTYPITITATDSLLATGTQAYTLTLGANGVLTLTATGSPTGTLTLTTTSFLQGESYRGPGFWIGMLSGQRARAPVSLVSAHPGDTTTDVIARLPDLAASTCGSYVVMIGTNDIGVNSNAVVQANITTIYQTLLATGKPVVLQTILPRTFTAAGTNQMQLWTMNRWIRQLWGTTRNLYIVDAGPAFGAPFSTTSTPNVGANTTLDYSYDGLHPKGIGAYHAFKPLADLYSQIIPPKGADVAGISDAYNVTTNPTGNLLPNGVLTFAGGTGTVSGRVSGAAPDGWAGLSIDNGCSPCTFTGTASEDALSDGTPAAKMVVAGTAAGGTDTRIQFRYTFGSFGNILAGDRLQASCRFEMDTPSLHTTGPFIQLVATSSSKTYQYAAGDVASANAYLFGDNSPTVAFSGILRTPDPVLALPAVPTLLQVAVGVHVSNAASGTVDATWRIGGCSLRKVPAA